MGCVTLCGWGSAPLLWLRRLSLPVLRIKRSCRRCQQHRPCRGPAYTPAAIWRVAGRVTLGVVEQGCSPPFSAMAPAAVRWGEPNSESTIRPGHGSWVSKSREVLPAFRRRPACARALFNCTIGIDGIGTFTGRFGFAFDQFLIYGKGGAAVEHAHYQLAPTTGNGVTSVFNGSATAWGWTAGAGVEFAFNPALSAFAEYDFLDFGSRATTLTDQNGLTTSVVASQAVHLVKVGLNYKFGQAPWAAATGAPPLTWTAPPRGLELDRLLCRPQCRRRLRPDQLEFGHRSSRGCLRQHIRRRGQQQRLLARWPAWLQLSDRLVGHRCRSRCRLVRPRRQRQVCGQRAGARKLHLPYTHQWPRHVYRPRRPDVRQPADLR